MIYLLAFLPAIGWGLMPVIAHISKGQPNEQLLGTTLMALLFGSVFQLCIQAELSIAVFSVSFFSGIFWAIGQYLQFSSFIDLTVSEAMPISNGTQLIGTTIVAAIFFKEWLGFEIIKKGIFSLALIIIGICFINYQEEQQKNSSDKRMKAILKLLFSSLALTVYVVLPRFFNVSGAIIIFPQALGMFFMSLVLNGNKLKKVEKRKVVRNLITGLAWSVANLSLFIVIPILGVSTSFTISQLSVLISLGVSLFVFKVRKTNKEKIAIFLGAILMFLGILLISSLKSN